MTHLLHFFLCSHPLASPRRMTRTRTLVTSLYALSALPGTPEPDLISQFVAELRLRAHLLNAREVAAAAHALVELERLGVPLSDEVVLMLHDRAVQVCWGDGHPGWGRLWVFLPLRWVGGMCTRVGVYCGCSYDCCVEQVRSCLCLWRGYLQLWWVVLGRGSLVSVSNPLVHHHLHPFLARV